MNEEAKQGLRCLIDGRVQGVCFRAATQSQASLLGLTGWVRNLPDGRVEVRAFGPADRLDELRTWLKKGPPMAHVLRLDCEAADFEVHENFDVLDTPMADEVGQPYS